jgi:hypothetical protein
VWDKLGIGTLGRGEFPRSENGFARNMAALKDETIGANNQTVVAVVAAVH